MRTLTINNRRAASLFVLFIAVAMPRGVCAQTATTGGIRALISDPSGAAVPGASVIVRDNATGREQRFTSDAGARISAPLLAPSTYTVIVDAPGFATYVAKNVLVQITEVTALEIHLQLRTVSQEVVVTSAPPLLQSENATIGRVIEHQAIVDLPLVNRNFTQLLGLTSGINTTVVDASDLGVGSQEIRANGARSGDNNFLINGVDANSYATNLTEATAFGGGGISIPAPDSIEEFKVQTSLYDAEYGRGAGANVNVETRSGTSQYHGSAYFFGRNDALNANNFFSNATGTPRGKFLRSQPGFTLGGPLLKDRIFFFGSFQATRDVNGASLGSSVRSLTLPPIPLDRSPASLGAVFGGQTGALGGVAVAPDGSNINPVALALLNLKNPDGTFLIPSPQRSGAGVNFTSAIPGRFDEGQFNTNVDFVPSQSDRFSVKFFRSNQELLIPFSIASVPGFPSDRFFHNRNLATTYTHAFSQTLINQFRFGFTRVLGASTPGGRFTDEQVGITPNDPTVNILPQTVVAGAFTLGNSQNDRGKTVSNTFVYSDTLSWVRRAHSLRTGVEVLRIQYNESFDFLQGSVSLLSFPDFLLGLPAGPVSSGGNGTDVSNVFSSAVNVGVPTRGLRTTAEHQFIQDTWKVTPNFTLDLGFRLEVDGQQSEVNGRIANFFPQLYRPPSPGGFTDITTSGFVLPSNFNGNVPPGFPRANPTLLNNPTQTHPEPRVALAYSPLKNFVIRSGYGIYANQICFVCQGAQLIFVPPVSTQVSLSGGANGAATLQKPFPNFPPQSSFPDFQAAQLAAPGLGQAPVTLSVTDPNYKEATVQQYTLDLQYQAKNTVFTVGYGGAKGSHLVVGRSLNQPILASPSNPVNGITTNSPANAIERVPFPGLSPQMFRVESSADSHYNSLQVTVKKSVGHGLQFLSAYTLSKAIDDAGDSVGIPGAFGVPILSEALFNNQNSVRAQRGLADFDRRHRFSFSYSWDLPTPKSLISGNRVAEKALKGWSVSGVTTLQSGSPFSILDSGAGSIYGSPSLFFTASLAPGETINDAVRGGGVDKRLNQFFNTSAFTRAPFVPSGGLIDGQFPVSSGGTLFGNLGRNILRGPKQTDFDIAILKRTQITERVNFIFRWEFINAFNTPNFANPSADIEAPSSFGVISGLTVNPRIMQFGGKIEF
jgi:Carboxypeptidase regulatory-like domain/TonB-dependent Receptor Plug Domain